MTSPSPVHFSYLIPVALIQAQVVTLCSIPSLALLLDPCSPCRHVFGSLINIPLKIPWQLLCSFCDGKKWQNGHILLFNVPDREVISCHTSWLLKWHVNLHLVDCFKKIQKWTWVMGRNISCTSIYFLPLGLMLGNGRNHDLMSSLISDVKISVSEG